MESLRKQLQEIVTFTQQISYASLVRQYFIMSPVPCFTSKCTFGFKLTVRERLSNVVLHLHYIVTVKLGGIHKLTLMGAACQLTEQVHQIEETGRTPAHRCRNQNTRKWTRATLRRLSTSICRLLTDVLCFWLIVKLLILKSLNKILNTTFKRWFIKG